MKQLKENTKKVIDEFLKYTCDPANDFNAVKLTNEGGYIFEYGYHFFQLRPKAVVIQNAAAIQLETFEYDLYPEPHMISIGHLCVFIYIDNSLEFGNGCVKIVDFNKQYPPELFKHLNYKYKIR